MPVAWPNTFTPGSTFTVSSATTYAASNAMYVINHWTLSGKNEWGNDWPVSNDEDEEPDELALWDQI
jgi:hypothetical protein